MNPTEANDKKPWAIYRADRKDADVKPGLYLCLFHGTEGLVSRPAMDNWGFDGPMIGPLDYVHTTYKYHIKIRFTDAAAAEPFRLILDIRGDEFDSELFVHDMDCLMFDGNLYGDWTVCNYPVKRS